MKKRNPKHGLVWGLAGMALGAALAAAGESGEDRPAPARRRVRRVYSQSVQWHDPGQMTLALPSPDPEPGERPPTDSRRPLDATSPAFSAPPRTPPPPEPGEERPALWILESRDAILGVQGVQNQRSVAQGFGWLAEEVAARNAERGDAGEREAPGEEGDDPDLFGPASPPGETAPSLLRGPADWEPRRPEREPPSRLFQPEPVLRREPAAGREPGFPPLMSGPPADSSPRRLPAAGPPFAGGALPAEPPRGLPETGLPAGPPLPGPAALRGVPAGPGAGSYGRIGTVFESSAEFRPSPSGVFTPLVPALPSASLPRPGGAAGAIQPLQPLGSPSVRETLRPPAPAGPRRPPVLEPGSSFQPMRLPQ